MKKYILFAALILSTLPMYGQRFAKRGFSLGADRDTLLYIIASPFDNWYINVGPNMQSYIGNTPDKAAYWNKPSFGGRVEIGKWIIPDLAVSLRAGLFHTYSQSRFGGNNPWTDPTSPINYDGVDNTYYPISVHGFSVVGLVTLDWVNLLSGYESGKRKRWHLYTPVGLGGVWLFGPIVNQNYVNKAQYNGEDVEMGDMKWNKELIFTGSITNEWIVSEHLALNLNIELMGARGSLDDHNYNVDLDQRHMDLIPSVAVGAKFNLLSQVTKYNPYTKTSSREKVNHEFLAFGTRNTIATLNGRIDRLNSQIDSVLAQASGDSAALAGLNNELDNLQRALDSTEAELNAARGPANVLEELINLNETLNLPSTIVYYQLDRYEIDFNGRKKLQNFAKEMAALDDTLEFYIIGAADSATGTIRHNQWLSERRCEAAFNMLVNHFHANANQFVQVPVGGITDYEPQENNRMALIILKTPVTEEIVARWLRRRR